MLREMLSSLVEYGIVFWSYMAIFAATVGFVGFFFPIHIAGEAFIVSVVSALVAFALIGLNDGVLRQTE